ncbi:unnamed protein product [Schistosoma turkestanicum]|nr:unnamed protein product [Schistosoma turkestanicum]
MTESGMLDSKTPKEMHDYMENLGLGFEYSCIRENNPISCHSWAVWCNDYKKLAAKSVEILKENCFKRNYGDSCHRFGSLKIIGNNNILRDSMEAFRAFEHGCKIAKQGKCCQAAGRLIADGVVSHTPNLSIAMQLFELGCQNQTPESCFHLGGVAMVLAKDSDQLSHSEKSLNTTDNNGNSSSISSNNNNSQQLLRIKAFNAWMEGCRLGHEFCCRNIAKMYSKGDGVEMNELKAKDFLIKADQLSIRDELKNTTSIATTTSTVNKTETGSSV